MAVFQAAAEPEPQTNALCHVRRIAAVPIIGPAWPQQRTASGRVGHPVERYGQRALFNVAPKTQTKQLSPANSCSRSPSPFRPADPAASLLLSSQSSVPSSIKAVPEPRRLRSRCWRWRKNSKCRCPSRSGANARYFRRDSRLRARGKRRIPDMAPEVSLWPWPSMHSMSGRASGWLHRAARGSSRRLSLRE